MIDSKNENGVAAETPSDDEEDALQPLMSLANALLDTDRLRIVARLVSAPANRMELAEATGLPHRELIRQLGLLHYFGLVKPVEPAPRHPDPYTPFALNEEAFRAARQSLGKLKGRKPRPTDARLMTLETFMPGGKLTVFPRKQEQMLIILDEVANKFEPNKQYKEQDINVILEEVNEDYCTLRRSLVDYGYLTRQRGVYMKNE